LTKGRRTTLPGEKRRKERYFHPDREGNRPGGVHRRGKGKSWGCIFFKGEGGRVQGKGERDSFLLRKNPRKGIEFGKGERLFTHQLNKKKKLSLFGGGKEEEGSREKEKKGREKKRFNLPLTGGGEKRKKRRAGCGWERKTEVVGEKGGL